MKKKNIPFSPPDITEAEVNAVAEVLRSGWITSGPKLAEFEKATAKYCNTNCSIPVSSATAGMELVLKVLDIKKGDEVITTPYTYTSTSNIITHRGIMPKFVDVGKDSFFIDIDKLYDAIDDNTKVILTVDIGGVPVDYDRVKEVLKAKNREDIILMSDSAHSFGATYKGEKVGGQFDFHVFSFHAVKNLTTAEGGLVAFNDNNFRGKEDLLKELKYTSLNGQSKDALSKMQAGAWKYDVITDGFKCNMTDIQAAIGLVQLQRYKSMLDIRRELFHIYDDMLKEKEWAILPLEKNENMETSYHLYQLRIKGFDEEKRNTLISMMAEEGIATNVHFIPLPMFTFYRSLGYNIKDYKNAYDVYANEITLPLYSTLSKEDAAYVAEKTIECVEKIL